MLTLDEVRKKLQDRNLAEVARRTAIGYVNLHRIKTGKNENPSYQTMVILSNYLESKR